MSFAVARGFLQVVNRAGRRLWPLLLHSTPRNNKYVNYL